MQAKLSIVLGWIACPVGTRIHFLFSMAWGYEATFVALIHAVLAWIAMHAAIMMASESMPYSKPCTVSTGTIGTLRLDAPAIGALRPPDESNSGHGCTRRWSSGTVWRARIERNSGIDRTRSGEWHV